MFFQISLHSMPLKLFLYSIILSSFFTETGSIGLSGCHGKCSEPGISFLFGIVVLAPFVVSTWIIWTDHKKKLVKLRANQFEQNGGVLLMKKLARRSRAVNTQLRIYTAEDMKKVTNNYSDRNVMRRCSPGTFYRGTLGENDNTEVVIMKMGRVPQSQIGRFVDQLILLSKPHRNLVKIMGCCLETHFPLLVYELHGDGNGNLFDCIRDEAMIPRFPFEMRVKAAAGAARGLAYLHSRSSRASFVHGNICSANILLDDSFDAKVFDALASNLTPRDTSCVYSDPEFISTGQLVQKSDVYSFGVILVELLMGGQPFAPDRQENARNLKHFVCLAKEGRLHEVLDYELITRQDAQLVEDVAMLARNCLSVQRGKRPKMKKVEAKLSALVQPK